MQIQQFQQRPSAGPEMGEEEAMVAVRREQITLVRQIRAAVREAAEKERQARAGRAAGAGGEREYSGRKVGRERTAQDASNRI